MSQGQQGPQRQSRKLLKLRLVATDNQGTDRIAVVPFPDTYANAQISALNVFAKGIQGTAPGSVCLRCAVKDKKGDWVWADFSPKDWNLVMEAFEHEIGVFLPPRFAQGRVYLSYGRFNGYTTTWTNVNVDGGLDQSDYPTIDRPKTYKEAVGYVKALIATNEFEYTFTHLGSTSKNRNFTFYTFAPLRGTKPANGIWKMIPNAAHANDELWQMVVPVPGGILGFMVD